MAYSGGHQRRIDAGHRDLWQLVKVGGDQGVAGAGLQGNAPRGIWQKGGGGGGNSSSNTMTDADKHSAALLIGAGRANAAAQTPKARTPCLLKCVEQLQAAGGQPSHFIRCLPHQLAPAARQAERQPLLASAAAAGRAVAGLRRLRGGAWQVGRC